MRVQAESLAAVQAETMDIDLSFTRWSRLKECPRSYYLRYVAKVPHLDDNFHTIAGKLPGKQAELFYRLKPADRKIEFFADTFEERWTEFVLDSNDKTVGEKYVDWVGQGRRLLKKLQKAGKAPPDSSWEIGKPSVDFLFKLAFETCKADAKVCSNALALMIRTHGLFDAEGDTELQFELHIDPEDDGNVDQNVPRLKIGGFIDLLIRKPDGVEVWDWKTTKYPDKLDIDQLILYSMVMRASKADVLKVGYLLVRQNRVDRRPVTPAMEYGLRKQLRQVGVYHRGNRWPANFREWKCEYCDVRHSCTEAKERLVSLRTK